MGFVKIEDQWTRKPERIEPFLDALKEIWLCCPDLRFGQLVVNVLRPLETMPSLFYLEDDAALEKVEAIRNKMRGDE